jgi:hypothetical protein
MSMTAFPAEPLMVKVPVAATDCLYPSVLIESETLNEVMENEKSGEPVGSGRFVWKTPETL